MEPGLAAISDEIKAERDLFEWRGMRLKFNDVVKCFTAGMFNGKEIYGRLVQVRKGCGQFGSPLFFIRKPDGGLITVENDMLEPCDLPCPKHDSDIIGSDYTSYDGYTETGFIIENPPHPKTPTIELIEALKDSFDQFDMRD